MFSVKTIRISIQLQQGTFGDGAANTAIIEGLPTTVKITKSGGEEKNKALVSIENLKLETIRQLTTLAFQRLETYNNIIQIDVGDKGSELSTVFIGEISSSLPKADDNGKISLEIEALTGFYPNLIPSQPVSVQGTTTIDKLMKQFAVEANYDYENKNVTGSVQNSVFIGSPIAKAKTLARQAGIDLLIDDNKFTIQTFAAPKDNEVPLINKDTGLFGYPSFSSSGISCVCEFNRFLKVGGYFKLESVLPFASGEWQITKLEHNLEAYIPSGGAWQTTITAVLPGGGAI